MSEKYQFEVAETNGLWTVDPTSQLQNLPSPRPGWPQPQTGICQIFQFLSQFPSRHFDCGGFERKLKISGKIH